jgi:TonB family protein
MGPITLSMARRLRRANGANMNNAWTRAEKIAAYSLAVAILAFLFQIADSDENSTNLPQLIEPSGAPAPTTGESLPPAANRLSNTDPDSVDLWSAALDWSASYCPGSGEVDNRAEIINEQEVKQIRQERFPALRQRDREKGLLDILVCVGPDGSVTAAHRRNSSGNPEIDSAGTLLARYYRFKPLTVNGIPDHRGVIIDINLGHPRYD